MNVAEMIVEMLVQEGVEYIFGIPGGAIEGLNNALYSIKKIKPIVTKHEQGAAYIADGYARVSGKLGVCCSTAGPGASNLITGLATSYMDGIPVCALTGQVATSLFGKGAFQESGDDGVNIVNIFRNFTKYSGMLLNEQRTHYMIQKAIKKAHSRPSGPVHISLPVDVMKKTVSSTIPIPQKFQMRSFDRHGVKEAAKILLSAKKTAIIAGWGVVLSRGAKELKELATLLNIPVATSPKGKGVFPESHPLSLMGIGFAGSNVAKKYIIEQEVDVLLAIGTSFNEMMSSGWDKRLLPAKHLIQIDVNEEAIGKNYCASIGLIGDAKTILSELCFAVKREAGVDVEITRLRHNSVEETIKNLKDQQNSDDIKQNNTSKLYHPKDLILDIQKFFPKDTIYFIDIGNVMAWAIRYMTMDLPYSFFVPLGFGGMGYSVAAPIGAKLACKNRPVVALVGDGSFLMDGMEVATAVNYNIPVIWVICNNSMFGLIHHGRKMFETPVPEGIPSQFKRVDFVKIAQGLGARGIKIDRPEQMTHDLIQDILDSGQPTVLDIWIDEKAVPPIHSRIATINKHFTK